MSSNDDEYQRQANDAQRMADNAFNDVNRAAWLRIAQGWLGLIKRPAQTAEQKFNDEMRDRSTGSGSEESN
jgi:hypothetical protein